MIRKQKITQSIVCFAVVFNAALAGAATPKNELSQNDTSATVIDVDTNRQLLVDDYLVERLSGGAERRLHRPVPQEIVIEHDEPWEGSYCNNHSIFKDGDIYRMYYESVHYNVQEGKVIDDEHGFFLCYAESDDGIHWRKPHLGFFEFEGSKNNNIILTEDETSGVRVAASSAAVFMDENPSAAADAKYKAVIASYTEIGGVPRGAMVFKSADAIHWFPMSKSPVISGGTFDSQNVGFWDAGSQLYRAYWRYMAGEDKIRSIRTATSPDFVNWDNYHDVRYVNSPEEHLYNNVIKSYYRAPDVIVGFPIRYIERPWSRAMEALPELDHRRLRSSSVERFGTALTEGLFMTSRDGITFNRWNEAFLPPGIERPGTWNYGHQFIGWTMVETTSALYNELNELSFYAVEGSWTGHSTSLRRYTLRLDGFVSINAPLSGGELLTKRMVFSGNELQLNFSSAAAGGILVELLDEEGNPIPGYTQADSDSIFGDAICRIARWRGSADLTPLIGKVIQLRFILADADLYSFKFDMNEV